MMKKIIYLFFIIAILLVSCKKQDSQERSSDEIKIGPLVDKIYMNVKMKEEIGLKDVAEGLSDVFAYGVEGQVILGLDQATKDKLDFYSVPSGSWSLLFNPVPNQAPYTVNTKKGEQYFNPYAIREIRFAMHKLISRKYIVDEILAGTGGPLFTMATPGQPGTYKYNLLASRMGITAEGNEEEALKEIDLQLRKAAALPALKGKLIKGEQWWMYNGEPVTIKFLIRVDDPQGRLKEGHYIADQIEKAGIKVDRLLWDRSKCAKAAYMSDPADYDWTIYTEGWGAGETRAFWDQIVAQMYAPWYGYMPGGADPKNWNYENKELDEVSDKAYNGNFLNEEEYWKFCLRGTELGLTEAVRIQICYQNQYYAANKKRFKNRMAYGLGDGLNRWSFVTANTTDGKLKITGYSAKGALFMHPWDPVGDDGYSDVYSTIIAEPTCEWAMHNTPHTAIPYPLRVEPLKIESKVNRNAKGDVVGEIPVDPKAIYFDSKTKQWVQIEPGIKVMSKVTYKFKYSNYHHGRPMSKADLLYRDAFRREWMNKDGADDRFHDATFEAKIKPVYEIIKGLLFNDDGTITTFFNYNFPPSQAYVAQRGAPDINIKDGRLANVCWEVSEACAKMVAEGSASGSIYSFTSGEATDIDMLNPNCVADIKAKLVEMRDSKHIPASVKDYLTESEVLDYYEKTIQWIDERKHAHIGCGPFYVEKFDPTSNYMELTAFRDPTYPYKSNYWAEKFESKSLRIDNVELSSTISRADNSDLPVKVYVSEVGYPSGISSLADKGNVSIMLITQTDEIDFKASKTEDGVFEARIPAQEISSLEPGSYTILVNAEIEGGALPASTTISTTVY